MNGVRDEELCVSDQELSEGDFSNPKAEVARAPEETSAWSGSDGEAGEDPLASPKRDPISNDGSPSTTLEECKENNSHNDLDRDRSGKISPIDESSGKTSPVNDVSLKNSPAHSRSKSPSPDRDVSMKNTSGSKSPSPDHVSVKNSPERDGSKSHSPRRVSTSPANGHSTSASPRREATSSVDGGRSQAASPMEMKSGSASPVNINSDTESEADEKNTSLIDLESDDDCILVEEGRKKASPEVTPVKPPSPPPAPVVSNSSVAVGTAPNLDTDPLIEDSPLRRSRRNTKRKSYQVEEDDSSDSDSDSKRKKLIPVKPATFTQTPQIKLVNTSLLLANNVKPMNQNSNGIVPNQVFTTMAQRGISISAAPRTPAYQPRPKKQPRVIPPPPFHKDSIFANMTNGQSIVEAPSFLSPLIFVKKPIASLREFVDELGAEVRKREEAELEAKRLKELEEMEAKRVKEEAELEAKRIKDLEDEAIRKEEELRRAEKAIAAGDPMEVDGAWGDESAGAAVDDGKEAEKDGSKDEEGAATQPKKKGRRRRKAEEKDESWSEKESEDSSEESDDNSGQEQTTTVLVQEALDPLSALAPMAPMAPMVPMAPMGPIGPMGPMGPMAPIAPQTPVSQALETSEERNRGYFASPLGGFFLELGLSLVQERVHTDLFRLQQKRMRKEPHARQDMEGVMQFLSSNIQRLKAANCHLNLSRIRCQFCSFRTESALVMAHHMEVPHAANAPGTYRCNFCPLELVGPQAALAHVSAAHGVSARLVKPPALHQCPECPFESGTRGRFIKHVERCFVLPSQLVLKPQEWQPPAKLIKASARPNYIFNSRPRFSARGVGPMRPLAPPFPQIMGPRAPRPRATTASVVTCGVCGSKWSDASRLRDHVLRDHAKALIAPPTPMTII